MPRTAGGTGSAAGVPPADGVAAQARALGHPSRYAIFDQLRSADRPVGVAELARALPLRPNVIRLHLATLMQADLVVAQAAAPRGRGRPAYRYRLSSGAIERWDDTGPHEELSLMLLDLLQTGHSPREVGQQAGVRLAGALSGSSTDTVDALVGVARRLGFEPQTVPGGGPVPEVVLARCPFAVGAERAPEVVCELHRGLAEGVCRGTGGPVRVADLVVRAPRDAGCRLVLDTEVEPAATRGP
ncbi:MAG: helix-turn-helix domain-containing protein [Dermatophilaceae bacterium]